MKKWVGMLLSLVMVLCMMSPSFAATAQDQIVKLGEIWYYDANGKLVTDDNVQFPGGAAVVELSKTVQPVTAGTENEFEVELKVRTTEKLEELQSDSPNAAVMLILDVSTSMSSCVHCGTYGGHNDYASGYGTLHEYVDRLTLTKAAAIDFLNKFQATAEDKDDERWVSIVIYGPTATRELAWVNVNDESQMETAKDVLGSIELSSTGGTNIEGALMLAANIWENKDDQMNQATAATIQVLDYKYTILLTDGEPTWNVTGTSNSTSRITGSNGGGYGTNYDDAKDVGVQAERLRKLPGLPKLYSICYGYTRSGSQVNYVFDDTPFTGFTSNQRNSANPRITAAGMTVGEWLGAFSDRAYNGSADESIDLLDTFDSIISQIKLAAEAWRVTDKMGEHVKYIRAVSDPTYRNSVSPANIVDELTWNILGSEGTYEEQTVDGTKYGVLTFVHKYIIQLDNLDNIITDGTAAYAAGNPANTNTSAELIYAVKSEESGLWETVDHEVAFPVPQVKGFAGNLEFTKVWKENDQEKALAGVKFTLTSKDTSEEGRHWTATATSDANGHVKFENIPSGHKYTLIETEIPGDNFVNMNPMDVTVSWGNVTSGIVDGTILNELAEKTVTLTLKKEFGAGNKYTPDEIELTLSGPTGSPNYASGNVELTAENNWTVTLSGLTPGEYTIFEDGKVDGYDLVKSATLEGKTIPLTFGSWKVPLTLNEGESHDTFAVVVTNTYTQQVGNVSVTKAFKEREHADLIDNAARPDMVPLDPSLYTDKEIEIVLTPVKGGETHTITLNRGNSWSADLNNIPVGEYTIAENPENEDAIQIDDHDFVHPHVLVNDQELTGNRITVSKNTTITLAVENHYSHHLGQIEVMKDFEGIDPKDVPADMTFTVNVYKAKQSGNDYVKDGTTPVTTITVRKMDFNENFVWSGTASRLPVGHYWLEEATPGAIDGYTFNNVSFASQVVEVKHNAVARATLTNTYQQQMGNLTVKKVFKFPTEDGQPGPNFTYPEYITVNVLEGSHSGDVYTTLELRGTTTPAWTASIDLPVGTYYLSEVTAEGVPGTADVENHGVTASWSSANVIIANGADEERTVTNTYTHDYGTLTIEKKREGVPDDNATFTFVVYEKKADGTRSEVVESIVLPEVDGKSKWVKSVHLPVGDYLLFEYGAHNAYTEKHYTLDSVTFNNTTWYEAGDVLADVEGYAFSVEKDATISIIAKNTYTRDKANLTIQKEFKGDLDATAFANKTITVGIYNGETLVETVELKATTTPPWKAEVELDAGVAYTLMEDRNSANVNDYNLLVQWSEGATVILEKDDNVTNILTNTYTQKMGTLTLHKIFSGMLPEEVELLEGKEIEVTVQSADENVSFEPRNIKLKGTSWSNAITLPVGTYTLTETAITLPGYDHEDAVFTGTGVTESATDKFTATVVVTENTTVDVRLTNHMERHTGSLTIAKEFTDDSALKEDYFVDKTINVLVKRNGQVYRTVTLPVLVNGEKVWSDRLNDVPTGAYTVEEVTAPGAAGSAHVNNHGLTVTYTGNNNTVAINKGDTATMTITNKYTEHVGNITVNKEFADETSRVAEDNIPNSGIAIHLYNESGFVATGHVSRENGGSHTFVELPVGTYYLEEETGENEPGTAWVDGYDMADPTWTGGGEMDNGRYKVEVTENTTATLTVTNTYTRNGSLTVVKQFGTCDTCGAVRPASVTVELYRVPAEGATAAERVGEPVVLNAGNKWNYVWAGLEAGTYSVQEVEGSANVANHTLSVNHDQATVTVAQDTTATAIITNTYTHVKGSLTIEKVFAQNSELNAEHFADKQISFQVKGPGNSVQTINLPTAEGKWEHTLTDLPVGNYTVEEVGSTAQVPGYGLIVTYSDAQNQGRVEVVAAADGTVPAKLTVTNSYTQTIGELKITKAFANGSALDGDDFSVIDVDILHKDGTTYRQIVLEAVNDWTWEGALPLGEYIVREVTTPGEAGSVYRVGYGLNVEYSDEAKNGSVTVGAAPAEITITNHYTYVPVYGSLMIKKEFKGEPSLYPTSVEFTITGPGYSQTVIVSATNNWTAYIGGLSGGEYTVTEAQVSGADYDLTTTWSSQGGKIYVYPGQTATITCTNAYYYKDTVSFRIPVEKTVHLIGSKPPVGAMQFSFGVAWQGSNGVTVRFENDPANTLGAFQQISANTYAATLNEPGTVKGYIVIEGYADQLAGFKLQTWENLTGYTDEEAAAAAGWTFDKTVTDGAINWNVEVGYTGQNGLGASIARTDTGLAGKVSFDNVYTSPVEVPETGDGENLALWIALCTVSALGVAVLLVSHKRKAFMANQ